MQDIQNRRRNKKVLIPWHNLILGVLFKYLVLAIIISPGLIIYAVEEGRKEGRRKEKNKNRNWRYWVLLHHCYVCVFLKNIIIIFLIRAEIIMLAVEAHVTHLRQMKNAYKILVVKLKRRDYLGHTDTYGRLILKLSWENRGLSVLNAFSCFKMGTYWVSVYMETKFLTP